MTKQFDLLEHLIEYYSQPGMGLACELRHPVTGPSEEDDSGIILYNFMKNPTIIHHRYCHPIFVVFIITTHHDNFYH